MDHIDRHAGWARAAFLLIGFWIAGTSLAHAHSGLQRAEPPVDSVLERAPADVKLHFSEQLEPVYSSVRVEDEGGSRVDNQDSQVDGSNRTLLRASLNPLEAGVYTVVWRVLSVDSHVTEGKFTFRVK